MPLRESSLIACVMENCADRPSSNDGRHEPGKWAIDWLADEGEPVYAAGAGIVRVGDVDATCAGAVWLWVDHGAGVVSRYHHVRKGSFTDGDLVTPATIIGRIAPCRSEYLHFEIRTGGWKGTHQKIGSLKACQSGRTLVLPRDLGINGVDEWDEVPRHTFSTPKADNSCIPDSFGTAERPANQKLTRGSEKVTVSWSPPAYTGSSAITGYVVSQALWSPSLSAWNAPTYRTVSASTRSATFTGLSNGRLYRYRVLTKNAAGNSRWTSLQEAVPAAAPLTPKAPRWLTGTSTSLRYAWWKAETRGTPTTSYKVALRRYTSSGWTPWSYTTWKPDVLSVNFKKVRAGSLYQITVKARSAAGESGWATYKQIRLPR
jgi:hypothetical protein